MTAIANAATPSTTVLHRVRSISAQNTASGGISSALIRYT